MAPGTIAILLSLIIVLNIDVMSSVPCPTDDTADAKAAYKSGELEMAPPITVDKIKAKLRESGVFDERDPSLDTKEKKELAKLFTAVEIMASSRNRQPSNVQNTFSSLRIVERAVKKQLKEGQLSERLAAKFDWDRLISRQKRMQPDSYLDEMANNRIFDSI